jgi:uncharacterized protein (DUF1330 family)
MAAYAAGAGESVAAYGGRLLGAQPTAVEGSPTLTSIALLEFPDRDSLQRWYHSPEYAQWKPVRQRSSSSHVVMFEGPPADGQRT